MNKQEQGSMLGRGTLCSISSTLVCVALGCIAIIVIVATLSELGVISFTKRVYQGAGRSIHNAYSKSAGWYNNGMQNVARAPQQIFRRQSGGPQGAAVGIVAAGAVKLPNQKLQQAQILAQQAQAKAKQWAQQQQAQYDASVEQPPRNETFNQFGSYGCMENFDCGNEYADALAPPPIASGPGCDQRIFDELGVIKKDLEEVKKNCGRKETFYNDGAAAGDNGDGIYFDDNAAENFGNLSNSETKAFGDGVVCQQGTVEVENIFNPVGALAIEGGSRCRNSDGVYDEIIGDMHPYYLNEIAARGEGNELIAATVRSTGNGNSGRSLMDEGKFYSQGQYFA